MNQHQEFVTSREKGVSKAGNYLVLSTLEHSDLAHTKCAYITTKKIGKANVRNRVRRQLRAIMQKHGDQIDGNRYLVSIARWKAADASFDQMEKDWLRLAKKLGVLKS